MIDLQREFLDVFVARIAKQKDHHDTELSVTPHLIWIEVLSDKYFLSRYQGLIQQKYHSFS